ncbi:hypothetical protein RhiirA4_408699, partial [Rhizophagus irregularis]
VNGNNQKEKEKEKEKENKNIVGNMEELKHLNPLLNPYDTSWVPEPYSSSPILSKFSLLDSNKRKRLDLLLIHQIYHKLTNLKLMNLKNLKLMNLNYNTLHHLVPKIIIT